MVFLPMEENHQKSAVQIYTDLIAIQNSNEFHQIASRNRKRTYSFRPFVCDCRWMSNHEHRIMMIRSWIMKQSAVGLHITTHNKRVFEDWVELKRRLCRRRRHRRLSEWVSATKYNLHFNLSRRKKTHTHTRDVWKDLCASKKISLSHTLARAHPIRRLPSFHCVYSFQSITLLLGSLFVFHYLSLETAIL